MSLLSSLGSLAKKAVSFIGEAIYPVSSGISKADTIAGNRKAKEAVIGIATKAGSLASGIGTKILEASGFVAKKVASTAIENPAKFAVNVAKGSIVTAGAVGVAAGGGALLLPEIYKGAKKATQTTVSIVKGEKQFTAEDLPAIGKTAGTVLGVGALGYGAGLLAEKLIDNSTASLPSQTNLSTSAPPMVSQPIASAVPLTPSTQVIGKEVSSSRRRYKKEKKAVGNNQSVKVNVYNQSRVITAKKFINSAK